MDVTDCLINESLLTGRTRPLVAQDLLRTRLVSRTRHTQSHKACWIAHAACG
ncbi:hypothetical protein Hanom_Chr15g01412331 [Helianthus anomalus]